MILVEVLRLNTMDFGFHSIREMGNPHLHSLIGHGVFTFGYPSRETITSFVSLKHNTHDLVLIHCLSI